MGGSGETDDSSESGESRETGDSGETGDSCESGDSCETDNSGEFGESDVSSESVEFREFIFRCSDTFTFVIKRKCTLHTMQQFCKLKYATCPILFQIMKVANLNEAD